MRFTMADEIGIMWHKLLILNHDIRHLKRMRGLKAPVCLCTEVTYANGERKNNIQVEAVGKMGSIPIRRNCPTGLKELGEKYGYRNNNKHHSSTER